MGFECSHVDISFTDENKKKLLQKNRTKSNSKAFLSKPTFRAKNSRIFSNAFRICEFCKESISLDTHNHMLSCPAVATPVTSARKKPRLRLTEFDPAKSMSIEKMRSVGGILKRIVEKKSESSIGKQAEGRRRCESPQPTSWDTG